MAGREGPSLSTRTVADLKSILRRAITRAQSRDKVRRNVVLLCGTPTGQSGRPSKALTLEQAQALVEHAGGSTMGTYVLMSLLTGARTEELRALTWSHLDLNGQPDADPPDPAARPWFGARFAPAATPRPASPDAPSPSRHAASMHCSSTATARRRPGTPQDPNAGSTTTSSSPRAAGSPLDAANVRRGFRRIAAAAGLDAADWTPRELRHSFVSLLSDEGVPIEQIARLVGHTGGSTVTETVYRKQLRPVIRRRHRHGSRLRTMPPKLPAGRRHINSLSAVVLACTRAVGSISIFPWSPISTASVRPLTCAAIVTHLSLSRLPKSTRAWSMLLLTRPFVGRGDRI